MNDDFRLSDEDMQALQADQQLIDRADAAQEAALEAEQQPELPQGEASTQAPAAANNDVTKPEKSLQDRAMEAAGSLMPGANVLTGVLDKGMELAQQNGLLPSEGVGGEIVDAAQGNQLEAPAMGLADFGVNTYNFLMPGEQFDVKRQTDGMLAPYDNKVKQTIRDVSSFLLPEILGMRGASLKMSGTRLPGLLGKVQKMKSVQNLSKIGATGLMGMGITDINLDPYGDLKDDPKGGMNAAGALKANWPQTWRFLPDGLATKYDDTPDEKRAKNRYEAMVFAGFEPLVSSVSRLVLNTGGALWKGLKYVPEVENAKKVADTLNKGNELLVDNLAIDKLMKNADLADKNLDDYGAYMLSKMQELDQPVKGVHTNFDVTELGTRSRDADGALGAMNDAYRIANNVDTYNGRIGSMYSSAAAKHGLELANVKKDWLVDQVVQEVKKAAKISTRLQSGKTISSGQRNKAVIEMWKAMTDINADGSMILDFATKMAKMPGRDEAIDRAIRTYRDQYLNLEKFKAQALLETSTAGQVADMSYAGSRSFDKVGTEQLQDELMDRLKVLMTTKMMSQMDQAEVLADAPMLKRWVMQGDEKAIKDIAMKDRKRGLTRDQRIEDNYRKVTKFIDTLNAIRAEKPHWMKPMMQFWEATDGRVDSMYKLNAAIDNSLGKLSKAIYDPNPEFPQLLLQEMQSTLYNSTLSAVTTAWNMTLGTASGQIDHIFSPYLGSMISGDFDGIVKHSAALASQFQHLGASLKVGADRFVQLVKDPDAAVAALKPDFAFKQSKILDALEAAGEASRLDGNDGIAMALLQREQLHALSTDPLFRLVPNIGGAADTISHDSIAWYQAHRQAYEKFFAKRAETSIRQLKPFGKKRLQALQRQIYRSMYDGDVLREPVAKYQAAEISLTKDNFLGDAMNAITQRVPPLKQAFMFPRMLGAAAEASVNFTSIPLMQKLGGFARRADQMSVDEMREVLTDKGMQNIPDSQIYSTYKQMRMKTRGRALLGSAFVTSGFMMSINGRLRGNGHYDPAVQKARGKEWQRSTFLGLDGKWHSHKALGPFSTLLDLIADIQDNFDTLGESPMENLGVKLAFILGGVVDDVNLAAGLVPFLDILQGKPTAMQRLAANTVNSAMPISGHRKEWSRLLDPQLEEVQRDFGGYLRAQNGWLDALSPETGLPESVNIIGEPIGADLTPFDRMKNAFTPFKSGKEMTPEQLALTRYEYPIQINFESLDGIDLNGVQQEELAKLVFTDPEWKRSLRRILKKYEDYDFEGKRQEVVDAGNAGTESPISKFYGLHAELDEALNNVKERVKFQHSDYDYIRVQSYWKGRNQEAAARGEGPVKTEAELYIESMNP